MSETRKTKQSEIADKKAEPASVKPLKTSRSQRLEKWARTLLGGALLFAACGTTNNTTNNYYYNPDGGAQVTDARAQEDAEEQKDAGVPDLCVPKTGPIACSDSVLAAGIIYAGESLRVGPYNVRLDGTETEDGVTYVVISITDTCGKVLKTDRYMESEINSVSVLNEGSVNRLEITANDVVVASSGSGSARVTVKAPCDQTDAGVQDDAGVQQDAGQSDACVPNNAPLFCSDTSKIFDGAYLNQGESLNISGKYNLILADIEAHGDTVNALFSIMDTCGGIWATDKLAEGETKTISIGTDQLDITATEILAGYTFGIKAAKFSISNPCTRFNWCLSVWGVLNQGEHLDVNDLSFQVDDFMQDGGKWYALFSVLDANGNIIKKLKIGQDSCNEIAVGGNSYKISVPVIGAGYVFGAKWAEVGIYSPTQSTCTGETNNDHCPSQ